MTNVYFISGMGASCAVFDNIQLPQGFEKQYIEWILPSKNESLSDYAMRMALNIDHTKPFILVGYSFGGVIVQEIAKFHKPNKIILLATISERNQIPFYFKLGRITQFGYWFPKSIFDNKGLVKKFFRAFIYRSKDQSHVNNDKYLTLSNGQYMGWAIKHLLAWQPINLAIPIFHIHAKDDPVFPGKNYKHTNRTILKWLPAGGHLMVLNFPEKVSSILQQILLEKTAHL